MFLVSTGGDDSTEEEIIVNYTVSEEVIEDALNVEKNVKGKGNWVDYMVCQYILSNFNWDEVNYTKMLDLAKSLENSSYEEILGEEKYELFKQLKAYMELIYVNFADIKKEKIKYKDKDGKTKYKNRYFSEYEIYYPIPKGYDYIHNDDFGAPRSYGGERNHLGNDIMTDKGTPIIAVADGKVEKKGWDELGGWRIGIRDNENRYWYYAHLSNYEIGINIGDTVKAGEIIGYAGDSGYGPIGTTGKFSPHLHIQLGIQFPGENELVYVNPYGILKFAENNKVDLENEEDEDDDDN